jgi:hypothetical protein
LERKIEDMS